MLLDQRGSGWSLSHASDAGIDLRTNTTWHRIDDLEPLRCKHPRNTARQEDAASLSRDLTRMPNRLDLQDSHHPKFDLCHCLRVFRQRTTTCASQARPPQLRT